MARVRRRRAVSKSNETWNVALQSISPGPSRVWGRALSPSHGIERAILSVSDKTGIVELARFLEDRNVEILSTGGTAKHLQDAGVKAIPIAQWSGAPEVFGGRVKTLNPRVFGGILYDRKNSEHIQEALNCDIPAVDLVVVNLYPFQTTVARSGVTVAEAVEQIDIGGPSMLRAAAKNHAGVLPLCHPSQYATFISEFESGSISEEFRLRAAEAVFRSTSEYDHSIAEFLARKEENTNKFPQTVHLYLRKSQDLRYGENPQQHAAFFLSHSRTAEPFRQLYGKELSYNNLADMDAAYRLVADFESPASAVIKHTNPAGVGTADTIDQAMKLAIDADPVSAFGGVVAMNRPVDLRTAEIMESIFLEVVIAPSFTEEALERFKRKKNLRLVESPSLASSFEIRTAAGGFLLQDTDSVAPASTWNNVSRRQVTEAEMRGLQLAWKICSHVKSNAIVLARETQSVGVGAGQMSRVDAAKIAIMKAILPTAGTVAASDAFFPFRDGLDLLAEAGVTAVVQPGGSVRDDEVVAAADEREMAMLFTAERHFRH